MIKKIEQYITPSAAGVMLTHLLRFFLEFLDGSLVDSATLVDEVAGRGGLAGVHVADDHDVDVYLLLRHDWLAGQTQRERENTERERASKNNNCQIKNHTCYVRLVLDEKNGTRAARSPRMSFGSFVFEANSRSKVIRESDPGGYRVRGRLKTRQETLGSDKKGKRT